MIALIKVTNKPRQSVGVSSQPLAMGTQGPKGDKGDAGYSPVRGVDYWTEADRAAIDADVAEALTRAKESGEFDGTDGKDGVSVTHSWNGTTLTVTSASGTSSADLKGDKGDPGVGIQTIQQGSSTESRVMISILLTDGRRANFYVKHGKDGEKGDTGAQGIQGKPGLVWRGEWDGNARYSKGNAVSYNGSSYICTYDNTPTAPDDNGADWELLAEKGDPGDTSGGTTIHFGDWIPGEIYQSEVGIKYKVGDLYLVDTEYDYGIYELVGIDTESDSDLAFPEWELKYVPRSPNNTPRVEEFNFDWCTTLDDFIDLLNAENGYEDSCEKTEGEYDGQIVVVSDVGDHGMDKDCSGAAIWVNTPKGYVWKKITQDYDKESIVADVIAALPVYDGSVV